MVTCRKIPCLARRHFCLGHASSALVFSTGRQRRPVCELSHRIRSRGKHDPQSPPGFLKWPAFPARGEPFQGRGGIGPKAAPLSRPSLRCQRSLAPAGWQSRALVCVCSEKNSVLVSFGGRTGAPGGPPHAVCLRVVTVFHCKVCPVEARRAADVTSDKRKMITHCDLYYCSGLRLHTHAGLVLLVPP